MKFMKMKKKLKQNKNKIHEGKKPFSRIAVNIWHMYECTYICKKNITY